MKKTLLLLLVIICLAGVLRLTWLAERPEGFTWDEAAIGYNAYSLLKTGRDEHSQLFPIVFKSFGDFKPGLYIYAAAPFIQLLGLTEFATRLPSAISGILLVIMIFILCKKLFGNCGLSIGHCAALCAAINPWLIHFSRGAWEANLCLLLTLLGINLYLSKKISLSAIIFGFTLLTYQSAKLLTPLIMFSLLILFRPQKITKAIVLPIFLFLIIIFPIIIGFMGQSGRLKVFSLTSYTRTSAEISSLLKADKTTDLNSIYYLFHSEKLEMVKTFALHYLNYLSPKFLFTSGDWTNLRHSTPFYGNFHLIEVVTMLVGFVSLIKLSSKKNIFLIIALLLLTPIPAALSRDLVSAVRSLTLAVPLTILSGIGLATLMQKKFVFMPVLFLLGFGLLYFTDLYLVHAPFYTAAEWLSPYKQAMSVLNTHQSSYKHVVFTDQFGQPYIFVLFYGQVDPKKYQGKSLVDPNLYGDVDQVKSFDKYEFGPVYWPARRGDSSTLFVGGQYELPDQDLNISNLIRYGDVTYPNGKLGFRIVGLQ